MRKEMFIAFVLYEYQDAHDATFFRRRVSGPGRAFARRSVPKQSGSLRVDRDANDYRPGDGDPIGRPRARHLDPTRLVPTRDETLKKAPPGRTGLRATEEWLRVLS
jgi:hypothetical protein